MGGQQGGHALARFAMAAAVADHQRQIIGERAVAGTGARGPAQMVLGLFQAADGA